MSHIPENFHINYNPKFIYGSERKYENTSFSIQEAVDVGFRAIDTANCCAYSEPKVGVALEELYSQGYKRSDFWLQSKFTFMYPWFLEMIESPSEPEEASWFEVPGYDHELDLKEQINQSFNNSLAHLHTDYLDSYILHGSFELSSSTLHAKDVEAWRVIEELYKSGRVRAIGVSNYSLEQISDLTKIAEIKPMVLQNHFGIGLLKEYDMHFHEWTREEAEMLRFCKQNNIEYQGIGNTISEEKLDAVAKIAVANDVSMKQVAFRFAYQSGVVPLTGTQNKEHIQENIDIFGFELTEEEVQTLGAVEPELSKVSHEEL